MEYISQKAVQTKCYRNVTAGHNVTLSRVGLIRDAIKEWSAAMRSYLRPLKE